MSLLHVANGHATTGLIELSGVAGRAMVWCDPLYDGPVPGNVSEEELVRVRAQFLAGSDDDIDDVFADLRHWRTAIAQQHYDELVLWYEHDLFDQLNLIQILTHLGRARISRPVSLVSIDSYPGHPDFKGIGELEPSDIPKLFEMRTPVMPLAPSSQVSVLRLSSTSLPLKFQIQPHFMPLRMFWKGKAPST